MKEDDKLYVKLIKNEMENTLQSGALKEPMAQYAYIETVLQKLLLIRDKTLTENIKDYFTDQEKLNKKIEQHQKELKKLIEEYGENAREMYEEIKKL